jgi:hypothetical protein
MNAILPQVLYQFLISLSLGTALFSWIAHPKLTGAGFMRLIVGHGAIFLVIALIVSSAFIDSSALIPQIVGISVLLVLWRTHPDERVWWTWLLYAIQVLISLYLLFLFDSKVLFLLSSFLLLGITHYSMLLGHYYLVVPKLTERPLLICLKLFWFVIAVKMIVSAVSIWNTGEFLVEGTTAGDGYIFNWIVVSMRWLWGYFALLVLSYFAWKLCRMRSIQSATGVLYIMVFFVFVGELLSSYLYLKHGLMI